MDSQEIVNLLLIAEKAIQWPQLKHLHDHAMTMLAKVAATHQEVPKPRVVHQDAPPQVGVRKLGERPDGMPTPTPMGVKNAS